MCVYIYIDIYSFFFFFFGGGGEQGWRGHLITVPTMTLSPPAVHHVPISTPQVQHSSICSLIWGGGGGEKEKKGCWAQILSGIQCSR